LAPNEAAIDDLFEFFVKLSSSITAWRCRGRSESTMTTTDARASVER
jgi:hypothetical protein